MGSRGSAIHPGFLENQRRWPRGNDLISHEDVSLRVGTVTNAYSPTDSKNVNRKVWEYDVRIIYANSNHAPTYMVYPRVKLASLFGGVADYFRWAPRTDNTDSKNTLTLGSEVLVMCINGNQTAAYIIGGVPHSLNETIQSVNHPLEMEINGIYASVDSDGALYILRKGATDLKGQAKNDSKANATAVFKMDKDGNIAMGFQGYEDDTLDPQFNKYSRLVLSKQAKQFMAFSENYFDFKTLDTFVVTTPNGVKVNPNSLLQESWVAGSSYREQQEIMHTTMQTQYTTLTSALTAASASFIAGTALNAIPIVGGLLASPAFAIVGAQLAVAAAAAQTIGISITQFEALKEAYLSKIHQFGDT